MRNVVEISKPDLLLWLAGNLVGVQEVGGANKGALVERFQKTVDGKANGESWCLAFVQFLIYEVDALGLQSGGDMTASPLPKSEWVKQFWESAPVPMKLRPTEFPEAGMLIVWRQWTAGQPTDKGHVGIIAAVRPDGQLDTIEGNTNDAGTQEGGASGVDGVYRKVRSVRDDGKPDGLRVTGFLRVWA